MSELFKINVKNSALYGRENIPVMEDNTIIIYKSELRKYCM